MQIVQLEGDLGCFDATDYPIQGAPGRSGATCDALFSAALIGPVRRSKLTRIPSPSWPCGDQVAGNCLNFTAQAEHHQLLPVSFLFLIYLSHFQWICFNGKFALQLSMISIHLFFMMTKRLSKCFKTGMINSDYNLTLLKSIFIPSIVSSVKI